MKNAQNDCKNPKFFAKDKFDGLVISQKRDISTRVFSILCLVFGILSS
jgi:hypothetical protein